MSIYTKLLEAKKEIGKISKDSKNPFFKSKYFDVNKLLDSVEPILQKNGLLLLQPIEDGKVFTRIIDIETSEEVSSVMTLPNLQDPQKLGSAITYYRRYTLQSLLSLQAEDDDANLAAKPPRIKTPSEKLNECKNLLQLATVYASLSRTEQTAMVTLKDELKINLK
tara:strand:- start:240 stop:737 length:498 start_codon:yes stop_codon:yes gene_type:complete